MQTPGGDAWCVYCLKFNNGEKTYVGATVDFARRLRQHNGELVGGAKYTTAAGAGWTPVFVVRGFPDQTAALQFEWALKRESLRQAGRDRVERRRRALLALMHKDRVTSRASLLSTWPLSVQHYA